MTLHRRHNSSNNITPPNNVQSIVNTLKHTLKHTETHKDTHTQTQTYSKFDGPENKKSSLSEENIGIAVCDSLILSNVCSDVREKSQWPERSIIMNFQFLEYGCKINMHFHHSWCFAWPCAMVHCTHMSWSSKCWLLALNHVHKIPGKPRKLTIHWELTWQIQRLQAKKSICEVAPAIALILLACVGLPFCTSKPVWENLTAYHVQEISSSTIFVSCNGSSVNCYHGFRLFFHADRSCSCYVQHNITPTSNSVCTITSHQPHHKSVRIQDGSGRVRLYAFNSSKFNFLSSWHSNRHCCDLHFPKEHCHFWSAADPLHAFFATSCSPHCHNRHWKQQQHSALWMPSPPPPCSSVTAIIPVNLHE